MRIADDAYPTREADFIPLFEWLVDQGLWQPGFTILDPCAGDGRMVRVAKERYGASWGTGVDIRPECATALAATCDYSDIRNALIQPMTHPHNCVITNPPFDKAREFIEAYRETATVLSAWLVRTNFLGTEDRSEWLLKWMPDLELRMPWRCQFVAVCKGVAKAKGREKVKGCGATYELGTKGTCECGGTIGDGTDACEYSWVIWRPGHKERQQRERYTSWTFLQRAS